MVGRGRKCLIKMVYDTIPRVAAASFLPRMVFSALTGALHGLLCADVANSGMFVPLPVGLPSARLGSLTAGDAEDGEGHRVFAKMLCRTAWGNSVSHWAGAQQCPCRTPCSRDQQWLPDVAVCLN